MKKFSIGKLGFGTLTALGLLLASAPASAATILVDHAICTLSDAIEAANADVTFGGCLAGSGADTIVLPESSTLVLSEELPAIESFVTIEANGSTITRDPSASDFTILRATFEGGLTLNEATITGGTDAGIYVSYAELTLNDCVITGNTGDHDHGGIVAAWGHTTVLNRSTVSGNEGNAITAVAGNLTVSRSAIVSNDGNGIYAHYTDLEVLDSTISSNEGVGFFGEGKVAGCTISNNAAAGIRSWENFEIRNSIVTGNDGSYGREVEFFDSYGYGIVVPSDHNVFGHDGDAGLYGMSVSATDIVPAGPVGSIMDPELAFNGGPTLTHLLRSDSPARDAGLGCSAFDQRGVEHSQGPFGCDIGAVELMPDPCGTAVASSGCTVNGVPNVRCLGTMAGDVIVGTTGADMIVARGGDDVVWAAGGDDIVCGGDGNDALHGGSGADRVSGGAGADSIFGDHGADLLNGGTGIDACSTDASDVSVVTCN